MAGWAEGLGPVPHLRHTVSVKVERPTGRTTLNGCWNAVIP